MTGPALLILAAGAGSRFRGPKQLEPVGPSGEALLEYAVFDALRAGFGRVVMVVAARSETVFRERFAAGMARRVPVAYVPQRLGDLPAGVERPPGRVKPWGTAHAVLVAASEIRGPFAVVNADDFYGASGFSRLASFFAGRHGGSLLAAVGFRIGETLSAHGPVSRALLETGDDRRLHGLVELSEVWREGETVRCRDEAGGQRTLGGEELVSMNLWGFVPELFGELGRRFEEFLRRGDLEEDELSLPGVVESLVRAGRFEVQVLSTADRWCGLTFPQDRGRVRSRLSSLVAEGRYPQELWR